MASNVLIQSGTELGQGTLQDEAATGKFDI